MTQGVTLAKRARFHDPVGPLEVPQVPGPPGPKPEPRGYGAPGAPGAPTPSTGPRRPKPGDWLRRASLQRQEEERAKASKGPRETQQGREAGTSKSGRGRTSSPCSSSSRTARRPSGRARGRGRGGTGSSTSPTLPGSPLMHWLAGRATLAQGVDEIERLAAELRPAQGLEERES